MNKPCVITGCRLPAGNGFGDTLEGLCRDHFEDILKKKIDRRRDMLQALSRLDTELIREHARLSNGPVNGHNDVRPYECICGVKSPGFLTILSHVYSAEGKGHKVKAVGAVGGDRKSGTPHAKAPKTKEPPKNINLGAGFRPVGPS